VTIDDARAFCFAQAKHLPTGMQWERAARGTAGSRFPWGDDEDETRTNSEHGCHHLVSADSMTSGATPEGVLHMIGNAAEWVDQPMQPSILALDSFASLLKPPATDKEPWYMIKGGSFKRSLSQSAADLWLPAPGRYKADDVGFRCAK
jgi:formylglycine-generating enzyme required for sulfatase activity